MVNLSPLQIISVSLINLNSFATNIIILLRQISFEKEIIETEYEKSQMEKMLEKSIVRVAIYKNSAYWVLNNVIYRANIDRNGNIIHDQAEEIDVFKLSEKEVNNLLTILDSISNE